MYLEDIPYHPDLIMAGIIFIELYLPKLSKKLKKLASLRNLSIKFLGAIPTEINALAKLLLIKSRLN